MMRQWLPYEEEKRIGSDPVATKPDEPFFLSPDSDIATQGGMCPLN
jgi:hypothetical protein